MAVVGNAIRGILAGQAGQQAGLLGGPLGLLLTTVALAALQIGLNYLQRPEMPTGGMHVQSRSGGDVPLSFVVGRRGIGGTLVYHNSYGEVDDVPNALYARIFSLGDLPGQKLVEVWVDGKKSNFNPAGTPDAGWPYGIPVGDYNVGGSDHLWIKFYDGTQIAADPAMVEAFASHATHPYGADRIGAGIPYAIVVVLVDDELWSGGVPDITFVVDGIPLYDVREDTTAGGAGAQRWADDSTWSAAGEQNLLVQAYNVLRGVQYEGDWIYGGQDLAGFRLPYASWAAALNECDDPIDLQGGGTEPQYHGGLEIFVDREPAAVLDELLKGANGRLAEAGGIYKPHVGAAGAAVISFDDGAILSTEPQTFDMFPSLAETVNGVTARYMSASNGWTLKDAPPRFDAALEAEDGGRRLLANATYEAVTQKRQVQRLMKSALKEARRFRKHTLPMPPELRVVEPLDVVAWTSARNGYSAKKFRVDYVEYLPNLDVILSLTEIDPSDYDWEPTDELPESDGQIDVIKPGPQTIKDFSAVGAERDGLAGCVLSWDSSERVIKDVAAVKFRIRRASDQEEVYRGQTPFPDAGSIFISQNLVRDFAYEARGQFVPRRPRPMVASGWLAFTTPAVSPWDVDITELFDDAKLHIAERLQHIAALMNTIQAGNALAQDALWRQVGIVGENFQAAVTEVMFAIRTAEEVAAGLILRVEAEMLGEVNANASGLRATIASVTLIDGELTSLASILDQVTASLNDQASGLDALAEATNALTAQVANLNGTVTATAQLVTLLSANVGDALAEGLLSIKVDADESNSAKTVIALLARAKNTHALQQAGLIIEAFVDGPNTGDTRLALVANKIKMISRVGGQEVTPFEIVNDPTHGLLLELLKTRVNGNLIVLGSILADSIKVNEITDGDSVTVANGLMADNANWQTITSLAIQTIETSAAGVGGRVVINFFGSFGHASGGSHASFHLRIWNQTQGRVIFENFFNHAPPPDNSNDISYAGGTAYHATVVDRGKNGRRMTTYALQIRRAATQISGWRNVTLTLQSIKR